MKQIKPFIALVLVILLFGPELTVWGLYSPSRSSDGLCHDRLRTPLTPGCVCKTDHGACSLEHPCSCCCLEKYNAAKANARSNRPVAFFICAQGCDHQLPFSLPTASRLAILPSEMAFAYQELLNLLPDLPFQELYSVYLIPPEKPPRTFLI